MRGVSWFRRASRARLAGACLGIVALALIVVLPVDSPRWVVVSIGTELVAVAVFLAAAVRMPSGARFVWWSLWAYLALTLAGDVVYDVLQYHFGVSPFPSWADLLYLTAYLPQLVALVVLMRQRQRVWDRQAWIDSTIITIAVVSVAATFVVLPMISASTPTDLTTYLALAYPLLDLVTIAILIRLTVGGGRPMTSLLLLTASVAVTMMADLIFNGLAVNGTVDQAAGWLDALFTGGVLLMAAAATDPAAAAIGRPAPRGSSIMSTPRIVALGVGALTAPVLLVIGTRNSSSPDVFFLAAASITVNVLVIWRILILLSTVQRQADRLNQMARTDALTGLPNRRSWDFELARAVAGAQASGQPVTVAIADIDLFKDYNDEYGHQAGDAILAGCARSWRAALDPSIFLARYGGEEFAMILPGPWSTDAGEVLDRMRRSTPPPVTVSVGYAEHDQHEPIGVTVERADHFLYSAKLEGRNRVQGMPSPLRSSTP